MTEGIVQYLTDCYASAGSRVVRSVQNASNKNAVTHWKSALFQTSDKINLFL